MTIQTSVHIYETIKKWLVKEYELSSGDVEHLLDTLEGLTDLHERVAALVREAVHIEKMTDALALLIANNIARKSRLEKKARALKDMALWAMTEAELPKIYAPDMTISRIYGPPHVIIRDDDEVPDRLCKIERTPMKSKIAEELKKDSALVPYAVFSNPEMVLRVSTK